MTSEKSMTDEEFNLWLEKNDTSSELNKNKTQMELDEAIKSTKDLKVEQLQMAEKLKNDDALNEIEKKCESVILNDDTQTRLLESNNRRKHIITKMRDFYKK